MSSVIKERLIEGRAILQIKLIRKKTSRHILVIFINFKSIKYSYESPSQDQKRK